MWGVIKQNSPQAGSLPFILFKSWKTFKCLCRKQCVQKHRPVSRFETQTHSCSLDSLAASPGQNVLLSKHTHTHTYTVYADAHSCIAHEGRSHLFLTPHQSVHLVLRFFRVYTSDYIRTDVKLNCFCLSFLASSFDFTLLCFAYIVLRGFVFGTRDLVAKKQMSKTSAAFTGGEHFESCVLCMYSVMIKFACSDKK